MVIPIYRLQASVLVFAGAVPFVLLALALVADSSWSLPLPEKDTLLRIFCSYALVIGCFICGSQWGLAMRAGMTRSVRNHLLVSNLMALFIWVFYLAEFYEAFIICFIVILLFLLRLDFQNFKRRIIEPWYFHLRLNITMAVSCCCIVALTGL